MITKYKSYPDARVTFEKTKSNDVPYLVQLFIGGKLYDRMRCDTFQGATEYWRAFNRIAKAVK